MDTSKQIVVSPIDAQVNKDVFVINDIELLIPPSQIEIRKEDLTFHYRTLRSKVATKVPTGNGQCTIHISVPFTDDTYLTLHRLIVEIRNSPFVYIDNRFVRESIVPDWPWSQNMAFTITGLNVSNMPNASNAMVLELDAVWFNYFPYMHNFLFREDWQTNWLRNQQLGDKFLQSLTIGWLLQSETYERQYYPNPLQEIIGQDDQIYPDKPLDILSLGTKPGQLNDMWSVVQNRFINTENRRTIYEMEQASPGIEFDLLPIPGNMMPSRIVGQPRHSRIFVRYMNFLQRDALMKSFGIDVRDDLLKWEDAHAQPGLFDSIFRIGTDSDGLATVVPLHSQLIPRSLRHKWIRTMLNTNHGVKLHYHAYKEIRLPQKYTDNVENKKNKVVSDLFARIQAIKNLPEISQGDKNGDPIAIPVLHAPFTVTSPFGWRNRPYPPGDRQFHEGIDFGAPRGATIVAPENGVVTKIVSEDPISGNYVVVTGATGSWYFLHMDLVYVTQGQSVLANAQLGTVGNTGRTNKIDVNGNTDPARGFHLHLGLKPTGTSTFVNPRDYLQKIVDQQVADYAGTKDDPEPDTYFDHTDTNQVELSDEEKQLAAAQEAAKQALALSPEETSALTDLLGVLDAEGWSYYDDDSTVTNTWKKLFTLQINHSGLVQTQGGGEIPEEFQQHGIILTSISGGLSHIVAKIPIIGHEFPTQQHLGSIEPEYQLEFAIVDDQSSLDGISTMAQIVQGMRSILQSNSRRFRQVVDGYSCSVDTFITRLLGTYTENDLRTKEADGRFQDFQLKKRFIVSSSYEGTVPGSPGLSSLVMSFGETNPYEQEKLVSTAPTTQDKDASRGKVLQAVYNLNLDPKYKDLVLPIILAARLGVNMTDQGAVDFGKFSVRQMQGYFTGDTINSTDVFFYREDQSSLTSPPVLLLKANSPQDIDFYRSLGIDVDYYYTDDQRTDFLKLNPASLDSYYIQDLNYKLGVPGSPYVNPQTGAIGNTQSGDQTIPADLRAVASVVNPAGFNSKLFDISSLLETNPDLAQIPFEKLMNYYAGIGVLLQTASRILAEDEVGGLSESYVQSELYSLPAHTDMWKSWEMYLEEFVKVSNLTSAGAALSELHSNPAWPKPNSNPTPGTTSAYSHWKSVIPESQRYLFAEMINGVNLYGGITSALWDFSTSWVTDAVTLAAAALSENVDIATVYRTRHETAITRLVNRYMTNMPLNIYLPDKLKQQYQYYIGDQLGNLDNKGKVPALESLNDALFKNAYSCGNITYDFVHLTNDNAVWQSPIPGAQQSGRAVRGGLLGAGTFLAAISEMGIGSIVKFGSLFVADRPVSATELYSKLALAATQATGTEASLYPLQTIGNVLNTPFVYPTDQAVELVKVKYIKGLLAAFADDILGDYGMLDAIGMTNLLFRDENRQYTGMECYPDLDLPAHPYYNSITQTTPDFYMWNIYEDGGAMSSEMVAQIQEKVEFVLDNCYASMKRMEKGENYDERVDTLIPETGIDDPIVLKTQITPEGTDGHDRSAGAMASPYYPTKLTTPDVDKWKKSASGANHPTNIYSDKPKDYIQGIRLANTEGLFGAGGGTQYPTRVGQATYDELQRQFYETNQLFGSSEGYINQEVNQQNTPEIHSATQGTQLERPPEAGHFFDPASLKKIALDSSKDMVSQKMTLKRAFPTFKLYFIEEDEFETRFLNFDDFYSYNAVKEISVVQSRKLAADTAVITLQNIAGVLDGTRRNSVADLDYASPSRLKQKIDSHNDLDADIIGGDPLTTGTDQDQPFGSVVLRPGLNVQLRMGYSNDADNLQVMISGRIVDVTWNKTGDLAEILIQSFGTELTQAIKGSARNEDYRTFYTTHELLGSLMLEPEVVHFGRWEFGQQFQLGEAKDYKLDFTDYSREGWIGRFGVTNWLSQWIMNHPYLTMGAAAGLTLANFFPFGRVFGANKFLAGVGAKFGLPLAEGAAGYKAIFSGARTGEEALEFTQRTKAFTAAGERLLSLSELATKTVGKTEFAAVLAARTELLIKEFYAASNVEEAVAATSKLEGFLQSTIVKSKWMAKPWVELGGAGFWGSAGLQAVGTKGARTLVNLFIGLPLGTAAGAFGTALALDTLIDQLLRPLYQYTIGGARKFFARTAATLFLTPQDDNLFPPHPKDYMTLDRTFAQKAAQLLLNDVSVAATQNNDLGQKAFRFLWPSELITKLVPPEACQYQLISTDIWTVFHEMSLRHPGWVYGARPYGNTFRYTMFFGLPAQRYWARPGSNAFVTRANQLRRFLDNRSENFNSSGTMITEAEFRTLYGDLVLTELKDRIDHSVEAMGIPDYPKDTTDIAQTSSNQMWSWEDPQTSQNSADAYKQEALGTQMASIAIKEYLRAVQIRFEPFRRYHMVTSDRDIVWNGIMGSEQAVVNAVDITYLNDPTQRADNLSGVINTAIFKAHSFIPEQKLRIAPVRWYNCKGYGMAMRYGMGELMDRMKDMYRGEIIILGNARIRPWDICVLIDSYNDIVGPIEVEQVVHTFSHETGYLTEIKPSAVVFANEISGWPLIEAMKIFSLAVHDIHKRYAGIKSDDGTSGATDPGSLTNLVTNLENVRRGVLGGAGIAAGGLVGGPIGAVAGFYAGTTGFNGDKFDALMNEKYKRLFGEQGADIANMFGSAPPPNLDIVDGFVSDIGLNLNRIATGTGVAGAAITLTGGLVAGTTLYQAARDSVGAAGLEDFLFNPLLQKVSTREMATAFVKNPLSLAAGAALLTGTAFAAIGFGAPLIMNQFDFPGAAFLMGGTALFLQCLRNDALIVVPITKNGNPIIAGLAYNDPQMLWKTFRGTINRWAEDTIGGTTDMISLYKRYGSEVWERINDPKLGITTDFGFGTPNAPGLDALTGEK